MLVFLCIHYGFFLNLKNRLFRIMFINYLFDKFSGKANKQERHEDKRNLVMGPLLQRRQTEQTKFVVPQIFVDYGSRRTSYASDYVRRASAESLSSRRTSFASDTDRRGSGSSLSSRRTSLASDADRRGSASSVCSRRTSLLSDCGSRRGSGSSKSSRKSSDASRFDDTDELLAGMNVLKLIFHEKAILNID